MQIRPMFVGNNGWKGQKESSAKCRGGIFRVYIWYSNMQIAFEGSLMNAILLFGISQHPSFMHKAEISHIYHMLPDHTLQHTHLS